jgi:hypothetical protein
MKIMFLTFSIILSLHASNLDNIRDVITDPAVSKRCKALISERNQKIENKQKLTSLLRRNTKLLNKLKVNQKLVGKKLEITKISLQNNLRLTKFRIKSMEENIVRKGCPGISL